MSTYIKTVLSLFCLILFYSGQPAPASAATLDFATEKSLNRLSGGLKIPTVGNKDYEKVNFAPFEEFKKYLQAAYPEVYKTMHVEYINTYSIVLHWKGKNPSLKPILFLSHYDVVPAENTDPNYEYSVFKPTDTPSGPIEATQTKWDYPAFSGAVAKGRTYGRGALDMKGMLFSIMEAADKLIAEGFQPEQDIWFAFGHDEETGGVQGAVNVSKYFKSKGMTFDAVFDEGGLVGSEGAIIPGMSRPLALIGLGEKGFLSLGIKVRAMGGHSSIPAAKSSLVQASEIVLLLNSNQMPARITPSMEMLLDNLKTTDLPAETKEKLQAKNRDELIKTLSGISVFNAMIRTTTAVTMMKGSDAPNVIAPVAEIVVNFRILPGDTVASVTEHVRALCKDYDVEISVVGSSREPSSQTSPSSKGLRVINESMKIIHPDVVIAPYTTVGGTDAYKYQIVSDNIYRFMPVTLNMYEIGTIHNVNEYISTENYNNMIKFFYTVMKSYHTYK